MSEGVWPKRLSALDVSRGLASLTVVFFHWRHFAYEGTRLSPNFLKTDQPCYVPLRLLYDKGALGVDYFFILSGFIFFWLYNTSIANRETTVRKFWVQRFSRLYPLHFVTLLIVAALQAVYISREGSFFVYPRNDLYHFVLNLGFASKWGLEKGWSFNGPVWSVSVEILLYVAFFIIAYLRLGKPWVCLAISVLTFAGTQFVSFYVIQAASLFFLGGLVYHFTALVSTHYPRLRWGVYASAALLWIATLVGYYFLSPVEATPSSVSVHRGVQIIFPCYVLFPLTISSLALLEIYNGPFLKPVAWVGDITYSSYLLHFPLQLAVMLVVSAGLLNADFYMQPLSLIAFFAVLIPLSYVTFVGFERPVQNLIRKRL